MAVSLRAAPSGNWQPSAPVWKYWRGDRSVRYRQHYLSFEPCQSVSGGREGVASLRHVSGLQRPQRAARGSYFPFRPYDRTPEC